MSFPGFSLFLFVSYPIEQNIQRHYFLVEWVLNFECWSLLLHHLTIVQIPNLIHQAVQQIAESSTIEKVCIWGKQSETAERNLVL